MVDGDEALALADAMREALRKMVTQPEGVLLMTCSCTRVKWRGRMVDMVRGRRVSAWFELHRGKGHHPRVEDIPSE